MILTLLNPDFAKFRSKKWCIRPVPVFLRGLASIRTDLSLTALNKFLLPGLKTFLDYLWNPIKAKTYSFQILLKKHCKNCEKLLREHLIGCQGVNLFLLKDVTINTFWVLSQFKFFLLRILSQFEVLSFLTIWVLSQFEFLSFVTIWHFEFCHK